MSSKSFIQTNVEVEYLYIVDRKIQIFGDCNQPGKAMTSSSAFRRNYILRRKRRSSVCFGYSGRLTIMYIVLHVIKTVRTYPSFIS